MKIGCSSWSFHRAFEAGKLTQLNWIKLCASKLSLDGIELLDFHFPSTEDSYLKQLKRLIIENGLTISCVSVSNNFGAITERQRNKEVDKVKKWTMIAYKLGAPILRIFAGWPGSAPWNEHPIEGADKERLWSEMIKCMKECSRYAEDIGVVLAVENHDDKGFIRTSQDIRRLVAEVGSDWVKINIDTAGYLYDPMIVKEVKHLIVHVHAKFLNIDEKGNDRILNYDKILNDLSEIAYNGFLSIEYEGTEDEFLAVPKVIDFLRGKLRL